MTFIVRPALETDAPALIALRRRFFEETAFMIWEPAEFKDTEDDERARIVRLGRQSNSLVLVAEAETQLVGLLSATGGERNQLRHSALLSLGVARSHWSQGNSLVLGCWSQAARTHRPHYEPSRRVRILAPWVPGRGHAPLVAARGWQVRR